MSTLKIYRFVGRACQSQNLVLIFCDASTRAYAAAVYLRIKKGSKYQTNILFSKLRFGAYKKGGKKQLNI